MTFSRGSIKTIPIQKEKKLICHLTAWSTMRVFQKIWNYVFTYFDTYGLTWILMIKYFSLASHTQILDDLLRASKVSAFS